MKTYIKNLFLLPALMAGFCLMPAGRMGAQTFTTLHSFTGPEGAIPYGALIVSGNTLYGLASNGGSAGGPGAVFAINTDGTGYTNLHGLTASDGGAPQAGLILSGNTLYGTTSGDFHTDINGNGTVFKVNTNGTGFTVLHRFTTLSGVYSGTNHDGARPMDGLVLAGNSLYGTAQLGGSRGVGTVFKVNTNGTGFTILHTFTGNSGDGTNDDGAEPWDRLILSGNTLYGTTRTGGGPLLGTVFKINTDGTGYTIVHVFSFSETGANLNGEAPNGLILSGSTLYGTTVVGGTEGAGTVFKVNTNGTGFTNLHTFTGNSIYETNDGGFPEAGLIVSGNVLYGTTSEGGSSSFGTVFAINTDGTGFVNLYNFTAPDYYTGINSDGCTPYAELILSGNTLYGTTLEGGSSGYGTVFSLSFAPQLTISPSGPNVILTWPTNFVGFDYTGFTLQSTTNLFPTAWTSVAQSAVTNAGQISVTVPTAVGQKLFRLTSP